MLPITYYQKQNNIKNPMERRIKISVSLEKQIYRNIGENIQNNINLLWTIKYEWSFRNFILINNASIWHANEDWNPQYKQKTSTYFASSGSKRLMDHHSWIGHAVPLSFWARSKEKCTHRSSKPQANSRNIRLA